MGFAQNYKTLHFRPFLAKTNDSILRKSPKNLFLGHCGPFFPIFEKMRIFLKNGVWGSLYPLMPSNFMQNMKKSNEPILNNIQKVDFFQLPCPLLLLFALFRGKKALLQKNDSIILNALQYSIYMQKNIKNGKTVQKIQ